ncbi:DNA polymerase I A, chloroplastic/mitochondrial isoform X6 [Arachis duranensis]|uniref:DNA-directed DNA polymerase n=1 Tax=Arachis duranensis TaxID=130453 RepID=A0A9C6T0N9_ARADU|nr:DNA polymerase I A, chloroplastic/mitochondrial isoform X4 [Arachis duranensis]XP_052107653.1 DNA polymerase I A, chloroplastic/mitochondrial isoform X6 [Arachis duranensis]
MEVPLRPYCPSCFSLSHSSSSTFPYRLALSSWSFSAPSDPPHRRRIHSVQAANSGHLDSIIRSNYLRFREGSWCPQRTSVRLNKCNDMRFRRNAPHKVPVCISLMKFSNASTGILEEMTKEGELNSLHPNDTQVSMVGSVPCNLGLSVMTGERKLSGGDYRGWANARYKLTESKKETNSMKKYERKLGSSYPSNRLPPNGQGQVVSRNVDSSLVLQEHTDHVLTPVKHSGLKNSNVCTDSETVVRQLNGYTQEISKEKISKVNDENILDTNVKDSTKATRPSRARGSDQSKLRDKLCSIYEDVLVVDSIPLAEEVAKMLTVKYRHLIHACDTEVAKIDVKDETPVDHGEIICFSIYSGPEADFGGGKSCIWVDVLDGGGQEILDKFAEFFSDSSIKKVWHNYSFDCHIIENYGFKVSGFHADTMHMARLWDSSRRLDGGYSLEGLTGDKRVMCAAQLNHDKDLLGKVSMKTIFGKKKVKKDGSEGKTITIAPVEELQRDERIPWICYSALDARSTLNLYESLKSHLSAMPWKLDGVLVSGRTMYDFYNEFWRPFGELLVTMESEGMLVDRAYLADIEKVAIAEQDIAANRFRKWACKYCPDAKYMNVGSDLQLRQLLFGGIANRKDPNEILPTERIFKIPNVDKVIEEGKKAPTKFRDIKLTSLRYKLETDMYTASGWPSVSGDALRALAGKISAEYDFVDENCDLDLSEDEIPEIPSQSQTASAQIDKSAYGTAFAAFPTEEEGREACHAIAALCEVCSINSLISNFILPLQGHNISGKDNRIHCSLNINTETGRLSARRPNLQNQPALEKDRYKIRKAFIAAPGNSLIVADYGQLELRILAHLANCKSMLDAFKAGGDFHSRTAMNMYPYIREAVDKKEVLLEWHPQPGEEKPPVPLLKDAFGSERRKAKMLNFSIAYGKTPVGLSKDWKVSVKEAKKTVDLWYNDRKEVLKWQEERKKEAHQFHCVHTLLGRARRFPLMGQANKYQKGHIERAAINTPVQGSAADVAMCAMLEISNNKQLKELGWKLLLQVHDEVILEGPSESAEVAKAIVVECMAKPFHGKNILKVDLSVDAKCAQNWYSAK